MLENPSAWKNEFAPVSDVDLAKCKEFCSKLTQNEQAAGRLPTGWEYRLPNASQWEYACRAGSTTKYAHGDDVARLVDYAWTRVNSGFKAHEVGQKLANPWGIHDMHGNIMELCEGGTGHGGGYSYTDEFMESYYGVQIGAGKKSQSLGFRVVLIRSAK